MAKIKYYDVQSLIKKVPDAHYYVIIGERSNGKTYSVLKYCLERYFKFGEEFAYIRRFDIDIKYSRGSRVFNNLINDKWIEKLSNGEWNTIEYYAGKWFLKKTNKNNPKDVVVSNYPSVMHFHLHQKNMTSHYHIQTLKTFYLKNFYHAKTICLMNSCYSLTHYPQSSDCVMMLKFSWQVIPSTNIHHILQKWD